MTLKQRIYQAAINVELAKQELDQKLSDFEKIYQEAIEQEISERKSQDDHTPQTR